MSLRHRGKETSPPSTLLNRTTTPGGSIFQSIIETEIARREAGALCPSLRGSQPALAELCTNGWIETPTRHCARRQTGNPPPLTLTTADHSQRKHLIIALRRRRISIQKVSISNSAAARAMSSFSFRRENGVRREMIFPAVGKWWEGGGVSHGKRGVGTL